MANNYADGRHDEIANILGVASKSFEDTYEDKAKEMKRTVLEYVKTLRAAGTRIGPVVGPETAWTTIRQDPRGFPMAPCPPSWDKVTKDELEPIYRMYLTQHYRQ